ncbi:MAG: pyruvate, phosphate dikinase [Caldiserica bacterium CG02_land_8_20_14_3_00_36_38]|nr:MAG: pyruvate, phosphate dikinase [Caldisericum sp. CG2_30_36_11]PIP50096.1 MAG: pyruvate, phosphate dikinase [Caldiserica bacterium CG23_combo_of_CG06-09_8_20_14_all_35_60]PIV56881.1 MAG: pyruvate, phosphate dikinase [Caldiserica bacterium CG02_land_8_20_14_3_00_36_38]PIX28770.1 MAG: pyruvate, phosphate dikinase [Caldiserica bacterium CG_4_8_14_3_um_filter_35_18]
MTEKWVYDFEEGNENMRDLLGGKGAGLAEMTGIGLPVPPGFTITTEACKEYLKTNQISDEIRNETLEHLRKLEEKTNKKLGDINNPLLVSVRSGAPISMPGMMDTILNLGLNDETVEGLSRLTQNERFAYDSYRRFIQMFSNVVMEIPHDKFEYILEKYKEGNNLKNDTELTALMLKNVIYDYKQLYKEHTGRDFSQDPLEQLFIAIEAVFKSWNTPRAITYRMLNKISEELGTAVNIVMMVFGNMGNDSATGVAFTRNPSTGEKKLYGEYLINAQGEDVVSGIRTPKQIQEMQFDLPLVYEQLVQVAQTLEKHYTDLQDMEFTIEKNKLYMLQTRRGKRTAQATVKAAVDMVEEGLISKEEAVLRVTPEQVDQLLHKMIDPTVKVQPIAKGLPASPGAASGKVVFNVKEAAERGKSGESIILMRPETTPEDLEGMAYSQGILTTRGGMTAHAAVVARGMGKPCIVGAEEIKLNLVEKTFVVNGVTVKENDIITIDGSMGIVIVGEVPMIEPTLTPELKEVLAFADEFKELGVRANANTPEEAIRAKEYGATGIGLCRTERMFLQKDRLPIMQEMIISESREERVKFLENLEKMQKKDFYDILKAMDGYPVIIRLLDPPLHEFLPQRERLEKELEDLKARSESQEVISKKERQLVRSKELSEFNPMIGFRGCRVGLVYPEIYEMQSAAIIEAAIDLKREGFNPIPKIMLPLIGHVNEMRVLREKVQKVVEETINRENVKVSYQIGTMIEVPRAALTADQIAQYADFFSYGTNDLTQTTFAYSRDDAEVTFLPFYLKEKILLEEPFMTIDRDGVGKLVRIGVVLGRKTNKSLEIGICGEHGGDPESIEFFHYAGLDYVSCSPFRVPIARLSAAQVAIREKSA